jgi:hypothetical protein
MAIMAMTTSSSIRVKPCELELATCGTHLRDVPSEVHDLKMAAQRLTQLKEMKYHHHQTL